MKIEMKLRPRARFQHQALLLIALRFAVFSARSAVETNKEALPETQPPAGLFVCEPAPPAHFELQIKTNGTYQVRAELGPAIARQSQEGTWKWDGQMREFSLTPNTNGGKFQYELHQLRLDKQQADTLLWITSKRAGHLELDPSGTTDYFRFKRKVMEP
jgi:hypothetical protein